MSAKRCYYETLEVAKGADGSVLKSAYRKLAMQFHPDKNPGDANAETKFKEINEAYDVLKDDQKRAAFDRFGHSAFDGSMGRGQAGGSPFGDFAGGFGDVFEDIFSQMMGGGRGAKRSNRGQDLRYDLAISLEEAYAGRAAEIKIPTQVACEPCGGAGAEPGSSPETCPTCNGDAVVLSEETIAIEFDRQLREIAARSPRGSEAFLIQMNPRVSAEFTGAGGRMLRELEAATGKLFHFEGTDSLPLGHFEVTMEGGAEAVRERAVPFASGDEVLVKLVEPHMYNVDDAVAKIDGYIVSVAGGGSHLGEQRMVKIEEAGRNSASATLLDAENGKDALDSPPQGSEEEAAESGSAATPEVATAAEESN